MFSRARFFTKLNGQLFLRPRTVQSRPEIKPIREIATVNRGYLVARLTRTCNSLNCRTLLANVGIRSMQTLRGSEGRAASLKYLALFAVGVQWIAFLHAGGILFGNERTEKYYDLIGSITYVSTLLLSLRFSPKPLSMRQTVLAAFVLLWTVRLGAFLFTRIHNNSGVDSRFTEMKKDNSKFLTAWTVQGMWVFITLLPVLLLNQRGGGQMKLRSLDYAGFLLWTFGFLFETVADYQKYTFRSDPANKEKFISNGLWSISRHPNYFGEITLWLGVALSAFSGTRNVAVFASPLFVSLLLIFVSGIPLLEKKADAVYADNEQYQKYKANTPVLVPFVGRAGDAKF